MFNLLRDVNIHQDFSDQLEGQLHRMKRDSKLFEEMLNSPREAAIQVLSGRTFTISANFRQGNHPSQDSIDPDSDWLGFAKIYTSLQDPQWIANHLVYANQYRYIHMVGEMPYSEMGAPQLYNTYPEIDNPESWGFRPVYKNLTWNTGTPAPTELVDIYAKRKKSPLHEQFLEKAARLTRGKIITLEDLDKALLDELMQKSGQEIQKIMRQMK